MKKIFDTMELLNWTPVIMFGLAILGIVSLMQLFDKQSKNEFINLEGKIVHNDYDPLGFRVFFAWCIFIAVVTIYVIYNAYAK